MNKAKISVIVPMHNNQDNIKETLGSILAQRVEMEIICLDGGSVDDTPEIVEELAQKDSRVKFIQGRRKNCGFLLNRGLREARGEYISLLASGDTLEKKAYASVLKIADREKLDFMFWDFRSAEENSCLSRRKGYFEQVFCSKESFSSGHDGTEVADTEVAEGKENNIEVRWTELSHNVTNGIYRRSFLRRNRIHFNELPGMQFPSCSFWFQIFMHGERGYLEKQKHIHLGKNSEIEAELIFKEYDYIGTLLHREETWIETFRKAYVECYLHDVLSLSYKVSDSGLRTYMEKAASALRELHDEGMVDYYALEPEEHKILTDIMYDTDRFVEERRMGETPRMPMDFMFPYHLFPEGSKVVIYGAGNVGRTIYRQAAHDGYVKIVGLVDKEADVLEDVELPVSPVKALNKMIFDYVLIAIRSRNVADEVKKDLIKLGITERKVKWDGTAYFRDEFYRNMYFPMLRAWNENYAEHGQFVHAYEIKMKGSINDHIFPYHLFREGTSVALYGAGDIGKKYYRQAVHDGYVKIAGIVDRNPAAIYAPDVPVKAMQELQNMTFDYVLITVHGGSAISAIKEDLKKIGIPENKIKWDGETYYRDEFYRNVYFPILRKISGDFQNRKQQQEELQKKLRYAIYDHIFPYHLFQEGETIAIYGAGDVGRKFYRQVQDFDWVKCVVIVDKNADKIRASGISVAPVGALKQFNFDKVLISMTNATWAREAREALIRMGIADERIKWAGEIYYREHFYQQYWFDYLRFVNGLRNSKL